MSQALPPRPIRLSPLAADNPSYLPLSQHHVHTPTQAYVNVSSPMSQFSQSTGATNRFHAGGHSTVSFNEYTGSAGHAVHRREYVSEASPSHAIHRTVNESVVSGQSTIVAGSVVGERVTEHRIRVPKKIIREDLYEKVIVIPERRLEEEIVETEQIVREKIVEIAKPVIQQKFVDVVEVEYRDKIVEVPEVRVEERITRVPRVEVVERVQRVPKIIRQEKIVEVPHTEYREVPIVKRVEVPQVQEQIVVKERPVTVYVDKPVPEYVDLAKPYDVHVKVPVPVAAEMLCDYEIPQIEQVVRKVPYNIFLPKFVEVPVPRPFVDDFWAGQATKISNHVALLTDPTTSMSLAEVEKIAADIHHQNPIGQLREHLDRDGIANLTARYAQGGLEVQRAADFVNSAQYFQGMAAVDQKDYAVRYRGVSRKSRGKVSEGGKHRRRTSFCPEQQTFWERICPEWLLGASSGLRQQANCDARHAHKSSPRRPRATTAQPVSFGKGYPSLRAAESRTQHTRRYSSDSDLTATSYCTSCSECNAQLQTIEASMMSRRH